MSEAKKGGEGGSKVVVVQEEMAGAKMMSG